MKKEKIAIIGLGRVGLPFLLFLEKKGFKTIGIDTNQSLISNLLKKRMPFYEKGCNKLLSASKSIFTSDLNIIKKEKCSHIIITVGTPLRESVEVDLSSLNKVIDSLAKILVTYQTIILRSTIGPETTSYIKNILERKTKLKVGKNLFLSFCPERLAENLALKELAILPQIIGAEDEKSYKKAEIIFKRIGVKIFKTNYLSAELVKLFNNNYRYIEFAMANQFAIIANNLDQNIYDIIEMCNYKYPRGQIYKPGLTGGTCLRKDFGMLNERSPYSDIFLSAWKINEYMPFHLATNISKKFNINGKRIGILGFTFKKNSDDLRESLVPKLIRQIEKRVPKKIMICEPNVKETKILGYKNFSISETIKKSDIIFIAMNHDKFKKNKIIKLLKKKQIVIDIWNHLEKNKFIFQK